MTLAGRFTISPNDLAQPCSTKSAIIGAPGHR
jgi:hypothetical protein